MRTDIQIMNLITTESLTKGMKRDNCISRKKNVFEGKNMERSNRMNSENPSVFKETFDQATHSREKEIPKEDVGMRRVQTGKECANKSRDTKDSDRIKEGNIHAAESAEKYMKNEGGKQTETAVEIIKNVLAVISEKLDLHVNIDDGLENLSSDIMSENVLEQMAEILYALKGISQLLSKSVENDVALDVKGVAIAPKDAAELEKVLRVQIVNLEMALASLGVAKGVVQAVSEKGMQPDSLMGKGVVSASSIPVALDPATLSMPEDQVKQIVGNMVKVNENQIEAVIARMVALSQKKSGQPQKPTGVEVEVRGLSGKGNHISAKANPVEIGTFDSLTMRRLLNVDKGENVVAENAIEKNVTEGTKLVTPTLSSGSSMVSAQPLQPVVTMPQETTEFVSGMGGVEKTSVQGDSMSFRMPAMPNRTLEETVMSQVTQRFSSAIKNGFQEIRLTLKPESLGEIKMTVQMEGDIVMARINVESQQVKQIVESNLQSLKDALEEHNLQAGSFDVNVNQGQKDRDGHALKSETGSSDIVPDEESESIDKLTVRSETGRRFGSNSIEFFA